MHVVQSSWNLAASPWWWRHLNPQYYQTAPLDWAWDTGLEAWKSSKVGSLSTHPLLNPQSSGVLLCRHNCCRCKIRTWWLNETSLLELLASLIHEFPLMLAQSMSPPIDGCLISKINGELHGLALAEVLHGECKHTLILQQQACDLIPFLLAEMVSHDELVVGNTWYGDRKYA